MTIENQKLLEALGELEKNLGVKWQQYEQQLKEAGNVNQGLRGDLDVMSKDFHQLTEEMKTFSDELRSIQQNGIKINRNEPKPSIGEQFLQSKQFTEFRDGNAARAKVHFQQNTILTESGSPQAPNDDLVPKDYMPGIIPGAFRSLRVLDVIPKGRTGSNTVHYARELLYTNNAAETAQGAQKPESVLTFEGVDAPVRTIPHFIKVAKQALDDAPFLASYIDLRLSHGVRQRIESQVIAGNGTAPNLSGITTSGNYTALTVVSGDNDFDAANRGKTQVEIADYAPTHFFINPADWGRLERTKTGVTNDKTYLAGQSGMLSYLMGGMLPTLWGLPVIKSNAVTAGTFICLAIESVMYVERSGVIVEMFEQDEDNVQKNLITVRAEAQGALPIFRPASIIVGSWPNA